MTVSEHRNAQYNKPVDGRNFDRLSTQMGLITGLGYVRKFGTNEATVTGADIWDGPTDEYNYPTENVAAWIFSTNSNDLGLVFDFFYLEEVEDTEGGTIWISKEVEATLDAIDAQDGIRVQNGSGNAAVIRCFRMKLQEGQAEPVGTVYISRTAPDVGGTPAADSDVLLLISPGRNQTRMSQFSLASNQVGYPVYWHPSLIIGQNREIKLEFHVRDYGSGGFRQQDEVGLVNAGAAPEYSLDEIPIAPKSDVKVSCIAADQAAYITIRYGIFILNIPLDQEAA